MSTQNTTAYTPVPVTQPPLKDGWYTIFDETNPYGPEAYYFLEGDWFETEVEARENENHDTLDVDGCYWLKPVDLSRMLEEAWDAGQMRRQQEIWHQDHDPTGNPEAPDFETFLSHLLNKEKP